MSEEKFVKNWKMKNFMVKLFSRWEKVRGFSVDRNRALVTQWWDLAPLPLDPVVALEVVKGSLRPVELSLPLYLSPLRVVSPG